MQTRTRLMPMVKIIRKVRSWFFSEVWVDAVCFLVNGMLVGNSAFMKV